MLAVPAGAGIARGMPELRDLGRPTRPNARDQSELRMRRRENIDEGSKPGEESASGCCRDTRCSGQRFLGGRGSCNATRPLGVDRSVANRCRLATRGNPSQPVRRIIGVFGATDSHAEIGNRDQQPSDRVGAEATVVQRSALDQQIRPRRCSAQLPDLSPEAPAAHGEMQIADSFAFDYSRAVKDVVTRRQRTHVDVQTEAEQSGWYPRFPFVNIGRHVHRITLARQLKRHTPQTVKKAPLLAISQSEMA